MAKGTKFNEVFPALAADTKIAADEAVKYAQILKGVEAQILSFIKVTADGIGVVPPETYKGIENLRKAYTDTESAALKLAQVETEKYKLQVLINKETERQAKNSQKAAAAVQKEVGAYKQLSNSLNEMRNRYKDMAAAGEGNSKSAKELLKNVNALDGQLKKIDATVGQHQRNVGNYQSALEGLPGPLGQAVSGVKALEIQFLKLLRNPIVALIAAIAGALMLLFKAFTATDSGGAAFARIMEQVGAVTEVLMDRVGRLAKALVLLFKGDVDGAAKEYEAATAGVEKQLIAAAEAAGRYADELERIEDAEISYISQTAKNANLIAKLEFDAANRKLSNKVRKESLSEAIRLGEEETEHHKKFLQDRYEAELSFVAGKKGIDKELLRAFVEANDENADFILQNNADLAKARDEFGDEGQKKLEEMHAAVINEDTKFFEQNKRNLSRMSGLEQEMADEKTARGKKSLEEKKKLEKEEYDDRERHLKAMQDLEAHFNDELKKGLDKTAETLNDRFKKRADDEKTLQDLQIDNMEEGATKKRARLLVDYMRETELHKDNKEILKQLEIKYNKDLAKIDEDAAAERKQKIAKLLSEIEKQVADDLENKNKKKIELIDNEIDAHKRRHETMRALAAAGNKDAQQSLTLEEKRISDLEDKRAKAAEKARKQELFLAAVQGYTAKLQSGDKNAAVSELFDLNLLIAGLNALPKFFEGTEHVASALGAAPRPGRDAYDISVDGDERIIPGYLNKQLGGMDNVEAVHRAIMSKAMDSVPSVNAQGQLQGFGMDPEIKQTLNLIAKNTSVKESTHFDAVTGYLSHERTQPGKTVRTHYRRHIT